MNIGEIRTRIHQLLLRPVVILHSPPDKHTKLNRILDSLLVDETQHVSYTARLIEQGCAEGLEYFIHEVTAKRLEQFNQITLKEVGIFAGEGN